MISLTLSNGTATPLTITDTGTSGYVLVSLDPGQIERDNTYARSRWLPGAALISTRDELTSLDATIQAWGSSTADAVAKVDALGEVLGQWGYTVSATYSGGGSATYTALPATYRPDYNPNTMRANMIVVQVQIPRQP